jgi:hyperosmotically inducible periplasmic protein
MGGVASVSGIFVRRFRALPAALGQDHDRQDSTLYLPHGQKNTASAGSCVSGSRRILLFDKRGRPSERKASNDPKEERKMRFTKVFKAASALALALILSSPWIAQANASPKGVVNDQQIQQLANEQLQKKDKFHRVSATADDGIVTLSGNVDLLMDKANAEKQVRKIKSVDGVRNHIEVADAQISDAQLQDMLSNKLRYDRVGYGIVFNSLTLSVNNGVATVGGDVRDYPDRDSAIAILETTPGVKDVVDEINVAPLSQFDDDLRIRLARAIYGQPNMRIYAIDPQAPIRIVVKGGHVELAGIVLSEADRLIAYTQANSVPGVFSVKNNLVVAPQTAR